MLGQRGIEGLVLRQVTQPLLRRPARLPTAWSYKPAEHMVDLTGPLMMG